MSESHDLIKELKRQLKQSGLHYVDVAQHLELSEGSVKRLLAEGSQSASTAWSVSVSWSG